MQRTRKTQCLETTERNSNPIINLLLVKYIITYVIIVIWDIKNEVFEESY